MDYESFKEKFVEDLKDRLDEQGADVKVSVNTVKEVYVAYRKAGYSKAFFEAHREEITLHKAAKQAFSELGVEKLPTVRQLNEEFAELLAKKKEAYREY